MQWGTRPIGYRLSIGSEPDYSFVLLTPWEYLVEKHSDDCLMMKNY